MMPVMEPIRLVSPAPEEPPALHERAMDNLRYIRETMERSTAFTGISGWGEVAIGGSGFLGCALAGQQSPFRAGLWMWIARHLISLLIAGWGMEREAPALQMPPMSGAGRNARV